MGVNTLQKDWQEVGEGVGRIRRGKGRGRRGMSVSVLCVDEGREGGREERGKESEVG